eukprot:1259682-Pleurochrysis_carterae.AAC.1
METWRLGRVDVDVRGEVKLRERARAQGEVQDTGCEQTASLCPGHMGRTGLIMGVVALAFASGGKRGLWRSAGETSGRCDVV